MTPRHSSPAVVSRRRFVTTGAVLVGGVTVRVTSGGPELYDALLVPAAAATTTVVERVRRSRDLLVGNLVLRDLVTGRDASGRPYVTPRSGIATGYLALVLPGQALGERVHDPAAFPLPDTAVGSVPSPAAELAPPTVLAFAVPGGLELPYDVPGLLDWAALTPYTATGILERPGTRIEAPFRLVLKPVPDRHRWSHQGSPVDLAPSGGTPTTELWHVRSRGRDVESAAVDDRLRSRARFLSAGASTLGALTQPQRDDIAFLSGSEQIVDDEAARTAVTVNHLSLTPLGATLDLTARWARSARNLVSWDHRATLGRDQYVKTVERGWLAPWGHDAVVISETWRRMRQDGSKPPTALLVKKVTLLITPYVDTDVAYARSATVEPGPRLPFTGVTCTVTTTPPLSNGATFGSDGGVPLVDGKPLVLPFVGTDWTGREVPFSSPVMFVPGAAATDGSLLSRLNAFNNAGEPDIRRADLGGHPVAVAPPHSSLPSGTTLPVVSLASRVSVIPATVLAGRRRAPFRPLAYSLETEVPQVSALAGAGTVTHYYHLSYRKDPENAAGIVLARFSDQSPPQIGGERTGGVVQLPTYQGLSRISGAVMASSPLALDQAGFGAPAAGAPLAADGDVQPGNVFAGITLLGGIELTDIVELDNASIGIPPGIPTVRSVDADGRQTVTMSMTPQLKDQYAGPILFRASLDGVPASLSIVAKAAAGGSQPAEAGVEARLERCSLQLAGLVVLPLERFRISVRTGAPVDVDFVAGEVSFIGPLAFLQTLCEVIALLAAVAPSADAAGTGGLAKGAGATTSLAPPVVDVDETGLILTQAIAVPDLPLGAFTLSGLAFGLGLRLPFSGALVVDLSFASKESPFQATYLCFGGGGYAVVQLTGGDVSLVEVGVHVAGELGVNLGVASGSLSVAVGIVMALPGEGGIELTAYFRACGRLSVLELVTLSATFELSLTFVEPASGPTMLSGKATLEFKVEVLFFSKTVTASVTRTLAGGAPGRPLEPGGPPPAPSAKSARAARAARTAAVEPGAEATTFEDAYPDAERWAAYCSAFVPAGGVR